MEKSDDKEGFGLYAAIRALAGYLPPVVVENEADSRAAQTVGIKSRHFAEGMAASDLAVSAAENLFARYPGAKEGIDFVLLCTQQPDYNLPTTACLVADRLGLPKSTGALDYNLGCSGYVYGLALAKGLIEAGMSKRLLLITAGLYMKDVNPKDAATWPVFGDGASATLLERVEAEAPLLDGFAFGTDGAGAGCIMQPVGGSRHPYETTPLEIIKDKHGEHTNRDMFMDGQEVMLFTLREVPPLVEQVLEKTGCSREDLDQVVFHQANKFMLGFVQKKCNLMDVPFFNEVTETGNTVASSIPLGLEEVLHHRRPQELRRVLLAGFGVGLSWAGCLADLSYMLPEKDS